jgi:hypothetical protein
MGTPVLLLVDDDPAALEPNISVRLRTEAAGGAAAGRSRPTTR